MRSGRDGRTVEAAAKLDERDDEIFTAVSSPRLDPSTSGTNNIMYSYCTMPRGSQGCGDQERGRSIGLSKE